MIELYRFWFNLAGRVDRRTYLRHGALLLALKFGVDALAVKLATGRSWSPLDYFDPVFESRQKALGPAPEWLLFAMALWALPFLWIGVSMTLRRLLDAGLSPWACLLFFVPFANWALMAVLSLWPPAPPPAQGSAVERERRRLESALLGVAASLAIALVSVAMHVAIFKRYTAAVFLGTPFTMGAAAGYFFNRGLSSADTGTTRLGALTVGIGALATLLFALEGAVCIAMALPLAMPVGALGAQVGAAIAIERHQSRPAALAVLLLLPLGGLLEPRAPLREVTTSIDIAAPPAQVWPHVLGFSDLRAPPSWLYRLGIAYPLRARLQGHGVGAVRNCEFSTGSFVEPITAWDEPHRLAFDVAAQPPPLTEWSPYRRVWATHSPQGSSALDGTLTSRRGEFRLIALPGGRTRLEGSTFYELQMAPQLYWSFWSDLLIHGIHARVLEQIRKESEGV